MDFPVFPHKTTFTDVKANDRMVYLYATEGECALPAKNIEILHAFKTDDVMTKIHIVTRGALYVVENEVEDMREFYSAIVDAMYGLVYACEV